MIKKISKIILIIISIIIVFYLISLLLISRKYEKKYNIIEAPISFYPVADYECIFTKKEKDILINKLNHIENKYKVKIRILTVLSFNIKIYNYEEKVPQIFGVNYKENVLILCFSKHDNIFFDVISPKMKERINEDKISKNFYKIGYKYIRYGNYFEGFLKMLEAVEKELEKSTIRRGIDGKARREKDKPGSGDT